MENNYKLTEAQYDALLDENTSIKKFNEIFEQANKRFVYVVMTLDNMIGRERDSLDDLDRPDHSRADFFKEEMFYDSEYNTVRNENFDKYDNFFPTTWLKEDFEPQVQQEINEFEAAENEVKNARKLLEKQVKTDMATMKENILAKLSPEEVAYINFKPFKEYIVDYDKAQAKIEKEANRQAHLAHISQYKNKMK